MIQTDFDTIATHLNALPARDTRYLVAIAGPPASGKSTAADILAQKVAAAAVVPMDGFHLSNETLVARDMLARKGAPETFDVSGFKELMPKLRQRADLRYPTFDRPKDTVVPGGGMIQADVKIALVEGNYLLLKQGAWAGLDWDISIWLDVETAVLEARLMQRWLDLGLPDAKARSKIHGNDLPNALTVIQNSRAADYAVAFCG